MIPSAVMCPDVNSAYVNPFRTPMEGLFAAGKISNLAATKVVRCRYLVV
jgi:hypothetical protein